MQISLNHGKKFYKNFRIQYQQKMTIVSRQLMGQSNSKRRKKQQLKNNRPEMQPVVHKSNQKHNQKKTVY